MIETILSKRKVIFIVCISIIIAIGVNCKEDNKSTEQGDSSALNMNSTVKAILFNPTQRILMMDFNCSQCIVTVEDDSHQEIKYSFMIKLNTSFQKLYLRIPIDMEKLYYEVKQGNERKQGQEMPIENLHELKDLPFLDGLPDTCSIYEFPETWNTIIATTPDRFSLTAEFRSSSCSHHITHYKVTLHRKPDDRPMNWTCTYNKERSQLVQAEPSTTRVKFDNLTEGNYCVQVFRLPCYAEYCRSYRSATKLVQGIIHIESEMIYSENKTKPVIIIICIVISLSTLAFIYFIYRRCKGSAVKTKLDEEDIESDIIDAKMKDIGKNSRKSILLLRCNEDEKINKDVANLIEFLNECCYCKVFHAKTTSAQIEMSRTTAHDWLVKTTNLTNKVLLLVTEKAHRVSKPEVYKIADDPSFCCFCDDTFSLGLQILKQRDDIKRIFVRFCYTKDKPLDELLDPVIEIPQALPYLFHTIHDQHSLVGKEEAVIRHWMKSKSFKHLYHLKNTNHFEEANSVPETSLTTDSTVQYFADTQDLLINFTNKKNYIN